MNPVKDLTHLRQLSVDKKAVTCPALGWRCLPAAFVISMMGISLEKAFRNGLYVYEKEGKEAQSSPAENDCPRCGGRGEVRNEGFVWVACPVCDGEETTKGD